MGVNVVISHFSSLMLVYLIGSKHLYFATPSFQNSLMLSDIKVLLDFLYNGSVFTLQHNLAYLRTPLKH